MANEVIVKSQSHSHLSHAYSDTSMKQQILQSGFLGALSGACGAFVACILGLFAIIFALMLSSASMVINDVTYFIFDRAIFAYVWLPGLMAGSFVGFLSGEWVASRPHPLPRSYIWALIGGLTSASTFVFVTELSDMMFMPIVIMVAILGMMGGLVARFVYGMLQRRFLTELQMGSQG